VDVRDGDRAPRKDGPLWSDRVYGAIGVAAVLLALFFLVRGGPRDDGAAAASAPPPQIEVLAPAEGAAVEQPLAVDFDAGEALAADGSTRGGRLHVHVRVGTVELMAGSGAIEPLGGTRYRWTLPRLAPGRHPVRLYWSDASHRPLAEGASRTVAVTLR
jgi:hypothetical protein